MLRSDIHAKRFITSPVKNKKFNQYYCDTNDGMKLRSGKVLNCIVNSSLHRDMDQMMFHIRLYCRGYEDENDYYDYGDRCNIMFILFEFLEKYYLELSTNVFLKKKYYDLRGWIKCFMIHAEHSSHRQCYCDSYYSDDIGQDSWLLYDEYNYFIDQTKNHSSEYKNYMDNYQDYNDRYLYRFHKKNFIMFIGGLRRMVAHDFQQITEELMHWYKYFSRSHRSDIKVVHKVLNKNTILNEDCINLICQFL
jgi:hypothetical protein